MDGGGGWNGGGGWKGYRKRRGGGWNSLLERTENFNRRED